MVRPVGPASIADIEQLILVTRDPVRRGVASDIIRKWAGAAEMCVELGVCVAVVCNAKTKKETKKGQHAH